MRSLLFAIFTFVLVASLPSCIEDNFTTSSSDTLVFSTDTLSFDTVFTGETTATHRFLVYNRHKKQLRISDISIDGVGDGAHFYMNVDGRSGERFSDIEVRGNDSLYVFVTARVDETSADTPFDVYGNLNFVTNGVLQTVTLRAAGQNAVTVSDWTISENTALTADRPYRVMDSLVVDEGATLRIPAGTTVYFHDKAKIRVKGTLLMEGTQGNPVRLRADRLDKVAGSIPFQLMSGQWDGVHYDKDSYGNEMAYVEMQGSSSGVVVDSCGVLDKRKLHIFNSVLHNSSSSVLTAAHSWIDAEGSEFSDASEGVVNLTGGKYAFNNCTFANYYLFSAITSPLLTLNYVLPKGKSYDNPLMDAEFNNCVVYGNASDISEGDLKGSAVYLRNCLLRSKGNDDDNFINCVWGGDPKFYTVRKDYIFDYRLKNESDAIGKGDMTLCPDAARFDMLGNDRFASGSLDLGAYVWIEQKEEEKQ